MATVKPSGGGAATPSLSTASSAPTLGASTSFALTTEQKTLQLQLIQRQYALQQSTSSHPTPSSDPTSIDLSQITSKALAKASTKRRPPNAHVQHYDDDNAYPSPLTPRTHFDLKRKSIARLTITLIMQLNIEQIRAIRADFDDYPDGVDMAQFVYIMTKHIYSPTLSFNPSPSLFIQSLIELFEAMDLDGDHSLEWEELLSTIVHMGMGATDHLVLSPINPYRPGPEYYGSKQPSEKIVRWHEGFGRVVYVETEGLVVRLEEPGMKGGGVEVKVGQNSVLCCEYIHGYGNNDEMKIGGDDTPPTPPTDSTKDDKRGGGEAQTGRGKAEPKRDDKGRKQRGDGGSTRKEELEKRRMDNYSFYKKALLFTSKDKKHSAKTFHSSQQYTTASLKPLSAPELRTGHYVTDPHSDETYYTVKERSGGQRVGNDDLLVTSTSQYLSLWEGLPGSEAILCDSKKVKCPYSSLRWCPATQRLFTGDVSGAVHSWKLVNAVGQGQHSKWAPSSSVRQQTTPKLVKERSFLGHRDVVTSLVTIPSMSFLLTAALDHTIRMWDIHSGALKNTFEGHRAGVVDLCYSNEYRFLLSASIDHDVCVWSPFAEHVVFKLIGHTSPLVGVQFVQGTPQIVTADTEGWVKVWDARNFTCCQTFMTTPNMTSFTTCGERHGRIFVVSRQPLIQVFDCEGGPYLKATDDDPVYTALYSSLSLSFLTCNRADIKLWNGLSGRLSRVYRGLSDAPISALCFDRRQRKLFVGDKQGKIRVYNALTGAYMKSLTPHADEVMYLEYLGETKELVSGSVDGRVKVHDERPIEEAVVVLELELVREVEVLGVCVSEAHHMIGVASSDGKVGVWSVDNGLKDEIRRVGGDVMSAITFLDPYPLLLIGDEGGVLTCYYTRPSHIKGEVAFTLPGRDADSLMGGITVLSWDNSESHHMVWVGNTQGRVLCYPLSSLIEIVMRDMEAQEKEQYSRRLGGAVSSARTHVRSLAPHSSPARSARSRTSPLPTRRHPNPSISTPTCATPPYATSAIMREVAALEVQSTFQAHHNAVSSITVVKDPRAIVTTARMHEVKVWGEEGELLGLMDSQGAMGGEGREETREWKFLVDVSVKEKAEKDVTEAVLQQLEATQREDEEKKRKEREEEEAQTEAERQHRRAAKRYSIVKDEQWLPVHWQQAVREGPDTIQPDALIQLVQLSKREEGEDKEDKEEKEEERPSQRAALPSQPTAQTSQTSQPSSAALTARMRSASVPVAAASKVRFGRTTSVCQNVSDKVAALPLPSVESGRSTTITPRKVEQAKEGEVNRKGSVTLPPLVFSATEPLSPTTVLGSLQPSAVDTVTEEKEQLTESDVGAEETWAQAGPEEGEAEDEKEFKRAALHQSAPRTASFTLGLADHRHSVKLNSAQLDAAQRLQRALSDFE